MYETFDLVEAFVDPDFTYHQAAARVLAEMARNLADSPVLPFDIEDYVAKMNEDTNTMLDNFGESMRNQGGIETSSFSNFLLKLSNFKNFSIFQMTCYKR